MKMGYKFCLFGLLVMLLAGCQSMQSQPSLYDQLGQKEGINKIVDALILEILSDRRIASHFEDTNFDEFHSSLSKQICELSGGPCKYEGDSMTQVHEGMDISEKDFNALVEDLYQAMELLEVPVSAQNSLVAVLAPFHGEIVR